MPTGVSPVQPPRSTPETGTAFQGPEPKPADPESLPAGPASDRQQRTPRQQEPPPWEPTRHRPPRRGRSNHQQSSAPEADDRRRLLVVQEPPRARQPHPRCDQRPQHGCMPFLPRSQLRNTPHHSTGMMAWSRARQSGRASTRRSPSVAERDDQPRFDRTAAHLDAANRDSIPG